MMSELPARDQESDQDNQMQESWPPNVALTPKEDEDAAKKLDEAMPFSDWASI